MTKKTIAAILLTGLMLMGGPGVASAAPPTASCWGQASAVFARMGAMGEHSSSFETPRLGLRNLARSLFADDMIADDSMAALGRFVADELRLEIDACS